MSFLHQHRLSITTLSPVHIGSNETYEPTNYVIDGDALYEFNAQQAIQALSQKERKNLLNIVNGKPDEQLLKQVQSFFYKHREALMAMSSHYLLAGNGVGSLYASRIGKTAQHEAGGKQVINKLGIERTAYNPLDRRPVFPGSSIKGAIRTAMLDGLNKGRPLPAELRKDRQANKKLQRMLLKGEFHTDPMRLVSISDARWDAADDLPGSEIRFAVNRRKKLTEKNGRLIQSMAEKKGLYQLLECVSPLRCRALESRLNLHHPGQVMQQQESLPAFQWSAQDIARACQAFYLPLLEKELQLVEQLGYADPDWVAAVRSLLAQCDGKKTFLLRLGRHSGAEAVTLNGVRSIKIMKGRDEQPAWEPAAKTIWLAAPDTYATTGLTPFGWVLVEIDPQGNAPFQPELQPQLERLAAWKEQLQTKHAVKKKQLEAQRKLQEEQGKNRLAEERHEQEEAAREQQALETARAALSSMGAEFYEAAHEHNWHTNKDAFSLSGVIEGCLDRLEETPDADTIGQLKDLLGTHFKGLLENPEKVRGKKKKPVYSERMREIVRRINAIAVE